MKFVGGRGEPPLDGEAKFVVDRLNVGAAPRVPVDTAGRLFDDSLILFDRSRVLIVSFRVDFADILDVKRDVFVLLKTGQKSVDFVNSFAQRSDGLENLLGVLI